MSTLPIPPEPWLESEVQPASAAARAAHVSTTEVANRVGDIPNSPFEVLMALLIGLKKYVCFDNKQTLGDAYPKIGMKIKTLFCSNSVLSSTSHSLIAIITLFVKIGPGDVRRPGTRPKDLGADLHKVPAGSEPPCP
jgi:hypothetical protein